MIFRWSIWGNHISKNIELLRYSILSFKKQFGDKHQYIVYTDDASKVSRYLGLNIDIRQFPKQVDSMFDVISKATWMKWCPTARLDIKQTEFYIDSDVFLLEYPNDVDVFLKNPKLKFGIMDEFYGQPWQHGAMQRKTTKDTPFVNAGFFVQKSGYSISEDLLDELDWWGKNISIGEQTHHDEQGALAIALTKYLNKGELYIFQKEKYMLIGPNENKGIESLEQVTLFHAVYPEHPAFYKFKSYLNKILGIF